MEGNPPKTRLPGKGESQPAVGEGGRPFEPGRIRDDLVLRARWESATSGRKVSATAARREIADEAYRSASEK